MSVLFQNPFNRRLYILFSKTREIQIGLKKDYGYNVPGSTAIAAGGSRTKAAEPLRPTCFIYYIVSSRERRKKIDIQTSLWGTLLLSPTAAPPPPPYRRFYGMCVAIIIIRFYDLVKWPFWGGFVYLLICTRDQRARTRRRGLSDSDLICSV